MKTIEYTTIDKSGWQPGPWHTEPDKVQWQDEATGLPCLAVRHGSNGHWCGYVGVSEGHPWYDLHYDAVEPHPDVHGGLTYSDFCSPDAEESSICHVSEPGEPDKVFWQGFDCAHAGDLCPGIKLGAFTGGVFTDDRYRDLEFVKQQCAQLCLQAKAAEND